MASSGSFILGRTSGTEYLQGRVEWSARQNADDVINNRSVVTAKLIFKRTNTGYTTYGTGTFTMTVNGNQYTTGSVTYEFTSADKVMIEQSVTIPHNSDGSKSFTVSATYTGNSPIGGSGSQSFGLNKIDRAAPTVSFTTANITASSIKINATTNVKCNIWQYSTNNGSTWAQFSTSDNTTASTTISGMSPNTSYAVQVRARRTSNHVYGASSAQTVKTLGNTVLNSVSEITVDAENPVINMNLTVYNASYRNKLTLKRGSTVVLTLDGLTWSLGTAVTHTIALTPEQAETVLLAMTDIKSFSGSFELETFNGSIKIGDTSTKSAAVKTSDHSAPFWSDDDGFVYCDSNAKTVAVTGDDQLFIQNQSLLLATAHPAVPKNGASIVSYSVTVGEKTVSSETTVLNAGVISSSGEVTVIVSATDSRGYTVSKTKFVTALPYAKVELEDYDIRRVNSVETYTEFHLEGKFSPVSVEEEDKNSVVSVRCRSKVSGTDTYGDWVDLDFTQTGTSFGFTDDAFGAFGQKDAYDIEVEVSDRLTTDTIQLPLPSAVPLMSLRSEKVGINKLNPEAALDVVGDVRVNGKDLFELIYPVGSIYMSVNNADPSILFGGTWTAWGAGRSPVGVGTNTDTEGTTNSFPNPEQTGGSYRNALSVNQMPAHGHAWRGVNDGTTVQSSAGTYPFKIYQDRALNWTGTSSMISTAGGGQSHNTMHPYITCYMWKRTS